MCISPGQAVVAQIPWGEWSMRGQIRGRVVRTDAPSQAVGNHCVAVEWLEQVFARSLREPER